MTRFRNNLHHAREGNIISTGPYHDPRAVSLSWYCHS